MTETDALWDRLNAFKKTWSKKRDTQLRNADKKTFEVFSLTPEGDLVVNYDAVNYACFGLGYFGLIGTVDILVFDALKIYRQRN